MKNNASAVEKSLSYASIQQFVSFFRKPDLFKQTLAQVTRPAPLIVSSVVGVFALALYIVAEAVPINSGTFLGASLVYATLPARGKRDV